MDPKKAERLKNKYQKSNPESGNSPLKKPAFGRGPHFPGMPKGKPKNTKRTIKRLFSYLAEDKFKIGIVILLVLIGTISNLTASYMIRPIINSVVSHNKTIANLFKDIVIMLSIYVISVTATYAQSRLMLQVGQKALQKIRNDLFHKMQTLPVSFFDKSSHGDLMSRFTNDVDTIGDMMTNTVVNMISGGIMIIGTFSLMLYTNIILSAITILMLPVMTYSSKLITNRSRVLYKQQQAAIGTLNGFIEETITGQKVVKVFNHEKECIEEFEYLNDDLRNKLVFAQFFGGIMGPVMGNLSQLNYVLAACVGAVLCIVRGFDIGGLTIFVNYARQFSRPVNELSMQVNTIFAALAGAERVFSILDEKPEREDSPEAVELPSMKGNLVLENVTFGYSADKPVLKNISLYAHPGQKIALVGSTGAGKTTTTNLINRFYDIQKGRITIDGVDIQKIKLDCLRRNIAMVLQDTNLFTGTVRENIRYGRMDATDAEVVEAAKIANAHEFIIRLSDGYDTVLQGNGANLSQGQRQLLNIARAAITKAPILILDEATSSVDTRTEKNISKAMNRIMANRTTLVIAHRLSTVRNADAIMVLENGEIIERGTHESLLQQHGRYYSLCKGIAKLQ
jgi:ATP-binding cassette, subfamily B, multidrug efflux pump